LPESVAKTVPAATSGWAARQENFESSDSVDSATTAWAMPAAHEDAPQPSTGETPETEETATQSASADAEFLTQTETVDSIDAPPPIAAWQSRSPVEPEPEAESTGEIPIINEVEDETSKVEETPGLEAPSVETERAESDETVSPIAEEHDVMAEDNPELDAPASDLEVIVIEESTEPNAQDDQAANTSENAISFEGDIAAPDAPPESEGDANPSPLEEAVFEEMLPYAAEAGSEWEPTAEPDEIFALDEIEFDDSDNLKAEALVVANESRPPDATAAISDSSDAAMQRANQLIDELRDLLPALTKPSQAIQSPEYAALRDQAIAARGDVSFDQFAALRDVVQEAVSRPRDVEVVLRLSQRVEDMSALLGERDRLQQAFEQLIAQLDANGAN